VESRHADRNEASLQPQWIPSKEVLQNWSRGSDRPECSLPECLFRRAAAERPAPDSYPVTTADSPDGLHACPSGQNL